MQRKSWKPKKVKAYLKREFRGAWINSFGQGENLYHWEEVNWAPEKFTGSSGSVMNQLCNHRLVILLLGTCKMKGLLYMVFRCFPALTFGDSRREEGFSFRVSFPLNRRMELELGGSFGYSLQWSSPHLEHLLILSFTMRYLPGHRHLRLDFPALSTNKKSLPLCFELNCGSVQIQVYNLTTSTLLFLEWSLKLQGRWVRRGASGNRMWVESIVSLISSVVYEVKRLHPPQSWFLYWNSVEGPGSIEARKLYPWNELPVNDSDRTRGITFWIPCFFIKATISSHGLFHWQMFSPQSQAPHLWETSYYGLSQEGHLATTHFSEGPPAFPWIDKGCCLPPQQLLGLLV